MAADVMDHDAGNTIIYHDRHLPSEMPLDHRIQSLDSESAEQSPSTKRGDRQPRSAPGSHPQHSRQNHHPHGNGDGGPVRRPSKHTYRFNERPIAIRKRSSASDLHRPSSLTDERLQSYLSSALQESQTHLHAQPKSPSSPPRSSSGRHILTPSHNSRELHLTLRQVKDRQTPSPQPNRPPRCGGPSSHQVEPVAASIPNHLPPEPLPVDLGSTTLVGTILEVDEGYCETDDSLSWLEGDRDRTESLTESLMPTGIAGSRLLRHHTMLKYKRSQEAAMQCPTVVRNVPRMRRRRRKEDDRRRRSLAASEAPDMRILRTPSPASMAAS